MESYCVKSIGLEKQIYENQSKTLIEDLKGIKDIILDCDNTTERENLLEDLLSAIESLINNKEAFEMCLSLAISYSDDYTTLTYYEDDNLDKRIYDDVSLLPTYCIISHDLNTFIFIREISKVPNPLHIGRKSNIDITVYSIDSNRVVKRNLDDTDFSFRINELCLKDTSSYVEEVKKRLLNNR